MTAPFSFVPSLSIGGKNLVVLTAPNDIREICYGVLRYKYSNIFDVNGGEPTVVTISPREKFTMSQTVAMGAAALYYAVLKADGISLETMWMSPGKEHFNRLEGHFSFADWITIPKEEFLKGLFDLLCKKTEEYAKGELEKATSLLGLGDFRIWISEAEKIAYTLGLLNPNETALGKEGIDLRIQECNRHIETIKHALANAISINGELQPIIDAVKLFVANTLDDISQSKDWSKLIGYNDLGEFIAQIRRYAGLTDEIKRKSEYQKAADAYRIILSYKAPEAKAK